mgnify:CR=1 FL=1
MNNYFIILAAGSGKRFNSKKPKQYYSYKNKEILEHSIEKAQNSGLFRKIILVLDDTKKIQKKYKKDILVLKGGKERSESSLIALKHINKYKPSKVLIHDAARPNFSIKLLKNLIFNLKKSNAVIPVIIPKDSIKYKIKNNLYNLDKNKTMMTQTPQAFNYKILFELAKKEQSKITDEASLFIKNNIKVKFIKGESQNDKITYLDDIKEIKTFFGIGFDIHRLIKNKKLYLGGIQIPFHSGLKGHSDGDVILHAIIDAILGAIRKKDIGTYFPNTAKFKNIRSTKMLKPIIDNLNKLNFFINNLDINLICEKPKVSKYREKIIRSIANLMGIKKDFINLKGKTVEKLGLIGKEEAIACEVIVSITKYD